MLAASSWLAKPVRMAAASAACGQAPGGTARGAYRRDRRVFGGGVKSLGAKDDRTAAEQRFTVAHRDQRTAQTSRGHWVAASGPTEVEGLLRPHPRTWLTVSENSKTKKSRRPKDLIRGAKAAASASYPRHRSPIRKVLPRKSWPPIACNWRARANVWRELTSPERGEDATKEAGNQGASSARLLKQPQTRKREMKRISMMPRAAAALRKTAYLDAHAGSTGNVEA